MTMPANAALNTALTDDQLSKLLDRVVVQRDYGGVVCPNERLMASYVASDLDSPERALVETHLGECEECHATAAEAVGALRQFDERRDDVWRAIVARTEGARLVALLQTLQILQRLRAATMHTQRAEHRDAGPPILAPLMDPDGNEVAATDGAPVTVSFHVDLFSIDDGWLDLYLNTKQQEYWMREGSRYEVHGVVRWDEERLAPLLEMARETKLQRPAPSTAELPLPFKRIAGNGAVQWRELLQAEVADGELPRDALRLFVRRVV